MDLFEPFCPDCRRVAAIPDTVPRGFRVTPRQMENTDPANWRYTDDQLLGFGLGPAAPPPLSRVEATRMMYLLESTCGCPLNDPGPIGDGPLHHLKGCRYYKPLR